MGKNSTLLFNLIAPIYGLFYKMQKSRYGTVIDSVSKELAKDEMAQCVFEMSECFSDVKVVNVDSKAAWYIGTPI